MSTLGGGLVSDGGFAAMVTVFAGMVMRVAVLVAVATAGIKADRIAALICAYVVGLTGFKPATT
jgi:hypothetical protein